MHLDLESFEFNAQGYFDKNRKSAPNSFQGVPTSQRKKYLATVALVNRFVPSKPPTQREAYVGSISFFGFFFFPNRDKNVTVDLHIVV